MRRPAVRWTAGGKACGRLVNSLWITETGGMAWHGVSGAVVTGNTAAPLPEVEGAAAQD